MRAVILIPYRGGNDRREWNWDIARWWLEQLGWPIFTGDDGGEPFSRAGSVNAAAAAAGGWDVALIGDADTIQELEPAHVAAAEVVDEGAVVPWNHRTKLSKPASMKIAQLGPSRIGSGDRDPPDRTSPRGGGGTLMVSRAAWEAVGGMDPGFRGYGNEDLAFVAALETLVLGTGIRRAPGRIWHLWHPHVARVGTALAATPPNRERWDRYREAHWKPDQMRELVG